MPAENMSSCGKFGRVIAVSSSRVSLHRFLFKKTARRSWLPCSAVVFKHCPILRFTPRRDRRRLPWPMAFDFEHHRPAKEGSDYDQSTEYADALGGFVQQD